MTAKNNKAHAAARLALAIGQAMEATYATREPKMDAAGGNLSTPGVRVSHALDLAKGLKRHKYQGQIVAWLERALEDARKVSTPMPSAKRLTHTEGALECLTAAFEHLLE